MSFCFARLVFTAETQRPEKIIELESRKESKEGLNKLLINFLGVQIEGTDFNPFNLSLHLVISNEQHNNEAYFTM